MALVTTPLDLYRASNRTGGPRFDYFRPGEIVVQVRNGVDWVLGPLQGGASTKEAPIGLGGTWYRLPKGTRYDGALLRVWNDYDDHWSWEPAQDMLLAEYVAALAALNGEFIRV